MQGEKLRPRKGARVSKGVRNRKHARGALKELRPGKQRSDLQSPSRGKQTQRERWLNTVMGSRRPPAAQPQGRGRNKRMDGIKNRTRHTRYTHPADF